MENLLINVENKSAANFITKVLKEFDAVKNIKKFSKEEYEAIIDYIEEQEDIKDADAILSKGEKFHSFDKVVKKWKSEGKL